MRHLLPAGLLFLLWPLGEAGDEAVLPGGSRLRGTLKSHQDKVTFVAGGKSFGLDELHHVRFAEVPCPLPRAPLTHRLLFENEQSIAGELIGLDADMVHFRLFTGETCKVRRKQVAGIAQLPGWQIVQRDGFEGKLDRWKNAAVDAEAFAGKKCLAIPPGKEVGTTFAANVGEGRLLFWFRGEEKNAGLKVEAKFREVVVARRFDDKKYAGWHLVQIDFGRGNVRVSVDDRVLANDALAKDAVLTSLRFEADRGAAWRVDEVTLLRAEQDAKLPAALADVDTVWLAEGDEVFGKIVHVDGDAITLEMKSAKRDYPWSQVRAVLFANSGKVAGRDEMFVTVAPGPGFAATRLAGQVQSVDDARVVVEHAALGKVVFPRGHCQRVEVVRAIKK